MGNPALEPKERFTYRHYKTWPDEERWELIDGQAWAMSPAPLRRHQELVTRFFQPLSAFLKGKNCKVFVAPFDVLLPEGDEPDDDVATVVQPDLVVYCDGTKLTRAGARGAPDFVVEILSPSTSRKDQKEKFDLYENRGVREYWVLDPLGLWLCRYVRGPDGRFDAGELREPAREYGSLSSTVLEGFTVEPEKLFEDMD